MSSGLIAGFLTQIHPDRFRRCQISLELDSVEIFGIGQIFKLEVSFYNLESLEIAARLAMKDLSNLMLNGQWKHTLLDIENLYDRIEN